MSGRLWILEMLRSCQTEARLDSGMRNTGDDHPVPSSHKTNLSQGLVNTVPRQGLATQQSKAMLETPEITLARYSQNQFVSLPHCYMNLISL